MFDMGVLSETLQKGRAKEVQVLVQSALDEGLDAKSILDKGLLSGMNIVGIKFKNNEIFVPEVLIAARAMNAGMEILKPLLASGDSVDLGTVIIGTVKGDLHNIGKNLVGMMMKGKGLNVIDLGTDVSAQQFLEEAMTHSANIIACSALLTTTMKEMANVVKVVQDAGMHGKIHVMIGGAPVTESFGKSIGADRYTSDAASAAEVALELCTQHPREEV